MNEILFVNNNSCGSKPIRKQVLKVENNLSEFDTLLKRKEARLNLGIGDSETLEWGSIYGEVNQSKSLVAYIDLLNQDVEHKVMTEVNTVINDNLTWIEL